jgi:ferritin
MEKGVLNLLNEQIWFENRASHYYLNLSVLCESKGFKGISKFFREQSNEEREHMLKICDYILERDEKPIIPSNTFLDDSDLDFDNILKIFEDSLFNEREITNSFHKIILTCRELGDFTTENFIQWFIEEQREEESKFKSLIDELRIIGSNTTSGSALYLFDKNIS